MHEGREIIKTALGQLGVEPGPDPARSQPTAATPGISWPFQLQFLAAPAPGGSLRPCLLTSGAAEPRSRVPSGVAGGETEAGLYPAQCDAGRLTAEACAGFGPSPWRG